MNETRVQEHRVPGMQDTFGIVLGNVHIWRWTVTTRSVHGRHVTLIHKSLLGQVDLEIIFVS